VTRRKSGEGSHGTRANRQSDLKAAARDLGTLGYRGLTPQGLKPKHVERLVDYWQNEQKLSVGRIKNRMVALRWWAEKVGKTNVIPETNQQLGIGKRNLIPVDSKGIVLDEEKLRFIQSPYVAASIRLQSAFGLRREEALKIHPELADKGDRLYLKGTWCKGGRSREIPILNESQRFALDYAKRVANGRSLIPENQTYRSHMSRSWRRETGRIGLGRSHGLRHQYALTRYEQLTGRKPPVLGGQSRRSLSPSDRIIDDHARRDLAAELGHSRPAIVASYIGA